MGSATMLEASNRFLFLFVLVTKAQSADFDVTNYGAKLMASQMIARAWRQACSSMAPSNLVIPSGNYMAGEVRFQGPCNASAVSINVQGTLQAPSDPNQFKSPDGWVLFQNIDGLTLFGGGTFDGQGSVAWAQNDCAKTDKCNSLPISLQFMGITNSKVQDIASLNSKFFHMSGLGCKNLTLQNVTINAPSDSLNTDGIHIGRSTGVNITWESIQTGDECVSLGDGCQQINIEKVSCGPGHGISVGSLGKYHDEQPVMGVTVRNCTLSNTMNGARIKTWPASPAVVAFDLHFEDIIMDNVSNPILIDQQYCPYGQCQAQVPSRIKISNVSFKNIRGTSATPVAVKLVCSKGIPCQNVVITDVNLKYTGTEGATSSQCANVKPTVYGQMVPPACSSSQDGDREEDMNSLY